MNPTAANPILYGLIENYKKKNIHVDSNNYKKNLKILSAEVNS